MDGGMGTAPIRVLVGHRLRLVAEGLGRALDATDGLELTAAVASVADCLSSAHRQPPDVLVVGHRLRGADGPEAVSAVAQVHPAVRGLLVARSPDRALLARALDAGCLAIVTEDEPFEMLVEAIRQVSHGGRRLSPQSAARLLGSATAASPSEARLTPREREMLDQLLLGIANDRIAERLGLSPNTVRNHLRGLFAKLGARSRLEAVSIALREGIVDPPATKTS
jgi:DNA-binding NarL/FixJ family response regulator